MMKIYCKAGTASGKSDAPRFVNRPVSVEESAQEIPNEPVGDLWEANGQALARVNSESHQGGDKIHTPERPPIDFPSFAGSLRIMDRGGGGDEIPNPSDENPVHANEGYIPVQPDIAIGDHEAEEICFPHRPEAESVEKDGVGVQPDASPPSAKAWLSAKWSRIRSPLPSRAGNVLSATSTRNNPSRVSASGGTGLPLLGLRRLYIEGKSTSVAGQGNRHKGMLC